MTVRCRSAPVPAGSGRPRGPGPVFHPQVLGQPDQHRAHQEGLVAVVPHVLDLQHGVGLQQAAEIQLVAALQEAAGGAQPQAGQPHLDEAEHVVGDPLAVADLLDDPDRGPLQVGEGRIPRLRIGGVRLAQRHVPAGILVTLVRAALSTWGNGSSDRNVAMNRALTRSAWVCRGNRRPSGPEAGSSGFRPAAMASDSPGLIRTTSAGGSSRAAISRYSALAGSTASHGIPARDAASSRARTVCDLPAPVAPHTKTWRLSDSAGSTSGPAGCRFRSRTWPIRIVPGPGTGSGVTSKSGRSARRTPGTSRPGGRVSAATSSLPA